MVKKMFERITPESAGLSSENILKFIRKLEKLRARTHGVLFAKGGKIFFEAYYKPYSQDSINRMYSQTKSFVSIAIGLLLEEGKLELSDPIKKYFPEKIDGEIGYLHSQTIEEMLTMSTAGQPYSSSAVEDKDRTYHYLNEMRETHPAGTLWTYDSTGSQVLCNLVEKLAGMSLLDYLDKKIFSKIGTFRNAAILKEPNGVSWGDSALLCTLRDVFSFGQLLIQNGKWDNQQLISESYVKKATSKIVDNRLGGQDSLYHQGYGYQIWRVRGGFAMIGMGDQMTVCYPEKQLVFSCTSDNQGNKCMREMILDALEEYIYEPMENHSLPENPEAYGRLEEKASSLELYSAQGGELSPFLKSISGKKYICRDNPMGIKNIEIEFTSDTEGVFRYENAQENKELPFGVNKNVYGTFPHLGYPGEYRRVNTEDGSAYKDAVSLAVLEERKILLFVQIIDRYLGNLSVMIGFKGNELYATFDKTAEFFLEEYQGSLVAVCPGIE